MKKRVFILLAIIVLLLSIGGCDSGDKKSSFSIRFIDVGQGDAALVECDGQYMLIDGGGTSAGNKIYDALQGITRLEILAISHFHSDHIGGLSKGLSNVSKIGITIANEDKGYTNDVKDDDEDDDEDDSSAVKNLRNQLGLIGTRIKVPKPGEKYQLGSAEIEVVDASSEEPNDSLVLLVTYKKTRFLFTGDIEDSAQTRISDKYQNDSDKEFKIDLMKMPHHGAYTGTLYRFVRTFMPDYVVISVGQNNRYKHPDDRTLSLLNNKEYKPQIYRTDEGGDIIVESDGRRLSIRKTK